MPDPDLRLEGVYEQAQKGRFMVRVKIPGGSLSSDQADKVCDLAERLASGTLHLTTRMSLEFHGVAAGDLAEVARELRAVGLTTRGACGGAVRGVAVSTPFSAGARRARAVAAGLQAHFTGKPRFEGLPKKFKVGVDGGYDGARHLIQDVGLVWVGEQAGVARYDAWLAGGLGREPAEAFALDRAVAEPRIVPLVEAAVLVHREHTAPGRRLRHLAAERGRDWLRERVAEAWARIPDLPLAEGEPEAIGFPASGAGEAWVTARVFAGELPSDSLRRLARAARELGCGHLILTPEQDVALCLADAARRQEARAALESAGLEEAAPGGEPSLRVCPGSHECRMGLAPTREVARALVAAMGPAARHLGWAISGCSNGCAQPQLAQVGVACRRLRRDGAGQRQPLFEMLRRDGPGFGRAVLEDAPLAELLEAVKALG